MLNTLILQIMNTDFTFSVLFIVGLFVTGFSILFLLCSGPLFFGLVMMFCGSILTYCAKREINEMYN